MIFFRYILTAWRFQRALRYLDAADAMGWSKEDEASLQSFFNSPPGRKLKARMTNNVIRAATDAVRKQSNWQNGYASGVADDAIFIQSHFPPVQSASEQSEEDEAHTALSDSPELTV